MGAWTLQLVSFSYSGCIAHRQTPALKVLDELRFLLMRLAQVPQVQQQVSRPGVGTPLLRMDKRIPESKHFWLCRLCSLCHNDLTLSLSEKMLLFSRSVVSDSLQPSGLQPTRLLHPWGFPRQEYQSGFPFPSLGGVRRQSQIICTQMNMTVFQ